jgi:hypothetical protein
MQKKFAFIENAISLANSVYPTPGGPHSIKELLLIF